MAEFRHLRAIFTSGESGCAGWLKTICTLIINNVVRFIQAASAIGPLTQRGIASLCIAGNASRHPAKVAFTDRIAYANVHASLLRLIRKNYVVRVARNSKTGVTPLVV